MQLWLRPDFIVHKDYPVLKRQLGRREKRKLLERTIRNAKIALRLQEEYGVSNVIYVVQGWDVKSLEICAFKYIELGVKMFGLGSTMRTTPQEFIRRVIAVRRVIGKDSYLHVFGSLKLSTLRRFVEMIDSDDTSTPIKAAAVGEIFVEYNNGIRRIKINHIAVDDLDLPANLKNKLFFAIKDYEQRGVITSLKLALILANTYTLKRYMMRIH